MVIALFLFIFINGGTVKVLNLNLRERKRLETKGWLYDVLTCLRELDKKEFTLKEMYGFEGRLQMLYPDNKHVRDKIRQQMQVLRDNGVIEFVRRGYYKLKV